MARTGTARKNVCRSRDSFPTNRDLQQAKRCQFVDRRLVCGAAVKVALVEGHHSRCNGTDRKLPRKPPWLTERSFKKSRKTGWHRLRLTSTLAQASRQSASTPLSTSLGWSDSASRTVQCSREQSSSTSLKPLSPITPETKLT
jgi:hypothetical protein